MIRNSLSPPASIFDTGVVSPRAEQGFISRKRSFSGGRYASTEQADQTTSRTNREVWDDDIASVEFYTTHTMSTNISADLIWEVTRESACWAEGDTLGEEAG